MPLIESIGMSRPLGMCSILVVASRLDGGKERRITQQAQEIGGSISTDMRTVIANE